MSSLLSPGQVDRLHDELEAGRKLGAIKLYMDFTGGSLSQASAFIESLVSEHGLEKHDSISEGEIATDLPDDQMDHVLDALKGGDKERAVTLYHHFTGRTKDDSTQFVEKLMQETSIEHLPTTLSKSRKGCLTSLLTMLSLGSGTICLWVWGWIAQRV